MLQSSQLVTATQEVVRDRLVRTGGDPAYAESLLARISHLEREKRELQALAAHLELNVKHLVRLAYVDGLTGLSNRRHFDSELRIAMDRAALSSRPLALLMCDIDRFKHYNDTYGHGHGDAVLTAIAGLLKTFRRDEQDCAARYGGEEFALLMPAMAAKDALLLAERIRKGVSVLTISSKSGAAAVHTSVAVTVSVGVTTIRGPALAHCRHLIDAADAALYRAKRAGGNRTRYEHLPLLGKTPQPEPPALSGIRMLKTEPFPSVVCTPKVPPEDLTMSRI